MPKALCYAGLIVGVLILLLFGLDLAIAVPFKRASVMMGATFAVAGAALAAVSWLSMREIK